MTLGKIHACWSPLFYPRRRGPGAGACRRASGRSRWPCAASSGTSGWGRIRNARRRGLRRRRRRLLGLEHVAGRLHHVPPSASMPSSRRPRPGLEHGGVHALRAQARHLDALVAVGDRQPLGEGDGGVLGHRVRRGADVGEQPGGRRGGEEVALAPLEHPGTSARAAYTWAMTLTCQIASSRRRAPRGRCRRRCRRWSRTGRPGRTWPRRGRRARSTSASIADVGGDASSAAASPSSRGDRCGAVAVEVGDDDTRRALGGEAAGQRPDRCRSPPPVTTTTLPVELHGRDVRVSGPRQA